MCGEGERTGAHGEAGHAVHPRSALASAHASRALDYSQYEGDKKFALFLEEFEKALALFEKAKEWADLIKCLQKMAGVLQKFSQYPIVPHKLTVAKRLAQCCNAALPSGVHLKSLELYNLCFYRIGSLQLSRDIAYYAQGLFPLYLHAATAVKPQILSVYSHHLLPLSAKALLPCLTGFIQSLLPGLAEGEGSEFFDPTLRLLNQVRDKMKKEGADALKVYWSAVWHTLLQIPNLRLAALQLLLASLPRPHDSSAEDPLSEGWMDWSAMPHLPDRSALVVSALVSALTEGELLTQRLALDLLLACFPLHIEYAYSLLRSL